MGVSLEQALKSLNKGKSDEDKYHGILGDRELKRSFLSTGSPLVDYLTGGGFVSGAYNSIVGVGGAGKTSISLMTCREATLQKKLAIFIDGEGTIDDSYIDRMGIDRNYFIHERIRNLEEMLDYAEKMAHVEDCAVIVIDSIPIFIPSAVEAKSANEDTMSVAARRYSQRMGIIEGNCITNDIVLLGLTSYRTDLSVRHGDNRILPAGKWQVQMMNTFLDITRKGFIFGDGEKPIGHEIDVRVKKAKTSAYSPTTAYRINFYYDGGFDKTEQYAELFVKLGIVRRAGAWYYYFDKDGVEQKAQGKDGLFGVFSSDLESFERMKSELENSDSSKIVNTDGAEEVIDGDV